MNRPTGGRSVVEQRAPREVERDDDQTKLWRNLDFFPTPPWAARAGAELVAHLDPVARRFCDPACGEGHIAGPAGELLPRMTAFDVHDYGKGFPVRDWLDDEAWSSDDEPIDWIFTNPPFALAANFVDVGLVRARRGVALLLRNSFVESAGRYRLFAGAQPLTLLAPFSERVSMRLGRWVPNGNYMTAYTWFFWMKGQAPRPPHWIGPGTKARLTRPYDADRYGWREPVSLLEPLE
jgi:hypothetical protein